MDNSSLPGDEPNSNSALSKAHAILPSRPEGATQLQYFHPYNQGGQRVGRSRGRGGFRARGGQRGSFGRGRGGYNNPNAHPASSLSRQSDQHYEPQRGRGRSHHSYQFQQTLGRGSIRVVTCSTSWSRTDTVESHTSDNRRHLGPLDGNPTTAAAEEHSTSTDAGNLWEIPTNDTTIVPTQHTEPQDTQLQGPRALNTSLHAASVPNSPIARHSPAVITISLPVITSVASPLAEDQVLHLTEVIEEPVQAQEHGFQPQLSVIVSTTESPTHQTSPGASMDWGDRPSFASRSNEAYPHSLPGTEVAGHFFSLAHLHHGPPPHHLIRHYPPPPPPHHHHYFPHHLPHPPPFYLDAPHRGGSPPNFPPLPSPPTYPPPPPYIPLYDPAYLALQLPLPRPPPQWHPILYLEYWGPEVMGGRPTYDVPMFAGES